ncbi:hypothetical protein D3C73_1593400 [compost metagenome]
MPRVASAISGEVINAVTSAMKAENACACAPKAPMNAATDRIEASTIAPTPTGLMSYR